MLESGSTPTALSVLAMWPRLLILLILLGVSLPAQGQESGWPTESIGLQSGDSIRGVWDLGFATQSTSQLVSVLLFVFSGVLLWRNRGKRESGPGTPVEPQPQPEAA